MKDMNDMIYLMEYKNEIYWYRHQCWTEPFDFCYDECVLRLEKISTALKMLLAVIWVPVHNGSHSSVPNQRGEKKTDKRMVSVIYRFCSLFSRFRLGRRNECTQFSLDLFGKWFWNLKIDRSWTFGKRDVIEREMHNIVLSNGIRWC